MKSKLLIVIVMFFTFCSTLLANEPIRDSQNIKTMSIHKTGFLSKKVTVINYDAIDGTILSVEVNGKMLPEKDFYKYEDMVKESIEYVAFSSLEPEYKDVLKLVDDANVPNQVKLDAIDSLTVKLSNETEYAKTVMGSHLDILKTTLQSEILMEQILAIMQESEDTWIQTVKTVKFKNGLCTVNKKKLSKELSARIYKLYEEHRGSMIEDNETVIYEF